MIASPTNGSTPSATSPDQTSDEQTSDAARGAAESGRRLEIGVGPTTLWVSGEIDMSTVDEFHAALRERTAVRPDRVLLDMSGVTFMDSLGLRALIAVSNEVPIQVVHPSEFVSALFFMTGLEDTFGV